MSSLEAPTLHTYQRCHDTAHMLMGMNLLQNLLQNLVQNLLQNLLRTSRNSRTSIHTLKCVFKHFRFSPCFHHYHNVVGWIYGQTENMEGKGGEKETPVGVCMCMESMFICMSVCKSYVRVHVCTQIQASA